MNNTVEYRPSELAKMLEDGFGQIHKPFARHQLDRSELWRKCISMISDHRMLDKLVFSNDVLRIPPVKFFICVYPEVTEGSRLTSYDKKFIGSFFSYIFTTIFCYRVKRKVGINNPCIRTALCFHDRADDIVILPDEPTARARPVLVRDETAPARQKQPKRKGEARDV